MCPLESTQPEGTIVSTQPGFKLWNGLLHQFSKGESNEETQQVVPQKLKEAVLQVTHDLLIARHLAIEKKL